MPLWLRRRIGVGFSRLTLGNPRRFGLPAPDHKLFETHPIVNSQLFYYLGHGRLAAKGDVAELCGDEVRFADGARQAFDLIIYATGYDVRFPFIDAQWLNIERDLPHLFLHAFHPQRDDLFIVGMIQPNGALWPLAELQAKIAAAFVEADIAHSPAADAFRGAKAAGDPKLDGGIHFADSMRHRLEVDYYSFRKSLTRLLARFPGPVSAAK